MTRRSLSTSTVTDAGKFVPWLAAVGPLAYTPEAPPPSDYYFQYGWVTPGVLSNEANKRHHFYFGESVKPRAEQVFAFWRAAKEKAVTPVASLLGNATVDAVTAPVAAYAARLRRDESVYVFMQHGSYQVLDAEQQPLLGSGEVMLYRGIGSATTFHFLRMGPREPDTEEGRIWQKYVKTQAHVLSDSTLSFNSIHDRAKRSETNHLRDGSWLTDDIARANGLDLTAESLAGELWRTTHQSFTLARHVAEWKFGPHFVKCKTPIDNMRLTTFFAGEHEVRIIDPERVEFLECVGCKVREVAATDLAGR